MQEIVEKIKRYCIYQDRSEYEVLLKLKPYKLSEKQQYTILEELKKEQFIDDDRFAKNYIRSKLNLKFWGKIKIKNQLQLKGVSSSIIKNNLEDIPESDYLNVMNLAIGKWLKINEFTQENYSKLYRYLLSKGFENSLIINQLKEYKTTDFKSQF